MASRYRVYASFDHTLELGAASTLENLVELVIDLYREDGYLPCDLLVVDTGA